MEISQNEQKGKKKINVQSINLTGIFVALAKESVLTCDIIAKVASALNIEFNTFSGTPNFIQDDPELGFIDGGFMGDIVIFYSKYFICFGTVDILGYYSSITPIKLNSFEGSYFEVKFTSDDKKRLKDTIKESKKSKTDTLEKTSDVDKLELLSKIKDSIITTTPTLEGYTISEYHGTVSAFSILKLDIFQEVFANFGDLFGGKSKGYAKKFDSLQNDVENKLKYMSILKGGNAVIGSSFDVEFIETSTGEKRMLGMSNADVIERKLLISGSGTSVSITKLS